MNTYTYSITNTEPIKFVNEEHCNVVLEGYNVTTGKLLGLCFPFDINKQHLIDNFNTEDFTIIAACAENSSNAVYVELYSTTESTENIKINNGDIISAGTPFIIQTNKDVTTLTFNDVHQLDNPPKYSLIGNKTIDCLDANNNVYIVENYWYRHLTGQGSFAITNSGSWGRTNSTASLSGFKFKIDKISLYVNGDSETRPTINWQIINDKLYIDDNNQWNIIEVNEDVQKVLINRLNLESKLNDNCYQVSKQAEMLSKVQDYNFKTIRVTDLGTE